jgi:hypothetical protein
VAWDGTDECRAAAAAGIYFARLRVGNDLYTTKTVKLD